MIAFFVFLTIQNSFMMIPQVNIDEEIIKIKTISIGGRRMTKAVFNQILSHRAFDNEINFKADKVIGFVNDSSEIKLLFIKDSEIRKCSLEFVLRFARLNDQTKFTDLNDMERNLGLKYFRYEDVEELRAIAKDVIAAERWSYLEILAGKAKSFVDALSGNQIFIAA